MEHVEYSHWKGLAVRFTGTIPLNKNHRKHRHFLEEGGMIYLDDP